MDQIVNLCVRGVLSAGSEKVAQGAQWDTSVPTLVEESEGLLVVCCRLDKGGIS